MSKELIVSSGRHETRVAILEDDQVVELFHEREKEYSLAGSIHKGRVTRVLPGMQSAFVDIGLERDAFLYVSDFFEDNEEYDAVVSGVEEKILKMEKGEKVGDVPPAPFTPVDITEIVPVSVAAPAANPPRETRSNERDRGGDRGAERSNDRGNERGGDRNNNRSERNQNDRTAAAPTPTPVGNTASDSERRGNRRGRRRRGGRGPGGLPDSKFYSPSEDATSQVTASADADVPETESRDVEPRRPEIHTYSRPSEVTAASGDDFMVLPGESLAKYSAPEPSTPSSPAHEAPAHETHSHETHAQQTPVVAEPELEEFAGGHEASAHQAPHAEQPEAAAPSTHEPETADASYAEASLKDSEIQLLAVVPVMEEVRIETIEVVEVEPEVAEAIQEMQEEAAAEEAAEREAIEEAVVEIIAAELADAALEEDEDEAEPELSLEGEQQEGSAELAGEAGESGGTEGEGVSAEEEGPEPARIPTSLTATLREQGHRYPHRVSRRMRRKMRGDGPPGEGAQQGNRQGAPVPAADGETSTVEAREERPVVTTERPERQGRPERQDRGDRRPEGRSNDRPDRTPAERSADRGSERGERTERGGDRGGRPERTERPDRERAVLPSIADLLKEGQEIIVQIAKEPLGQKGARITSHIALPGRFVVYMPTVDHVGVSRKIPSDDERMRLKKVLQTHRQGIPGGFICRTAGDGKTEEELKNDMHFLYNLWLDMRQKAEKKPAPVLLHHDLDLVERVLRDQLTSSFKTIWVDNEEYYESILRFVQRFQPALVGRVKLYTRATPIFDEFGVTNEVEKALRPKVWLKSGGYIVINQTEALVAIDINTGKYVGKSNRLEDTIVKINSDAIKEIVRQIRLRDLGGIIVVDFIDMDERKNRQKVMQSLEEAMRADRAPYKILQFNDFGLVAITRKRVKQSLERTLCAPCPYCEGAGYVKSVATVITEILQEAQRIQKAIDSDDVTLRVNPEVAKVLKSNQNTYLQEIEEILGRTVLIKNDPLLHQTKFDLA